MTDVIQVGFAILLEAVLAAVVWGVLVQVFAGDPETARFLPRLFLAAVLLRTAVALGTYLLLPYGYLAPDETGYLTDAKALLATGSIHLNAALRGQEWMYFNALLFHGFGVNPLLPRLWNCVVGGLTPILCYLLARRLGAGLGARWSALLVASFPSLVLWSSLNLKDADVYLLLLVGVLLASRMKAEVRAIDLAGAGFAALLLLGLRQYASLSLLAAIAAGLAANTAVARRLFAIPNAWLRVGAPIVGVGALLITLGVLFPPFGAAMGGVLGLDRVAHLRLGLAVGAVSATNPDPGLETLAGALAFLPTGLVDFFLRPFPWEGGSHLSLLTRPETIAYYLLILPTAIGVILAIRRSASVALPALTFLFVTGIGYALVLSNLGTIYRERGQLLLFMFAFAGVSFGVLRRRRTGGLSST